LVRQDIKETPMPVERFDFPSSAGHLLSARLDLPQGPVKAYALFAHCFTCGKDIHVAGRIANALAQRGIATVRFDFTGLGGSGGDFANTDFSSNCADLVAAIAHMRETARAPSLLIGHSLGGAAVLAVAGDAPEVRAVAVIAAPFDVGHVVDQFRDRVAEIEARGEAVVNLAGRPFTIRREFLADVREQDQKRRIAGLGRALLVLHSPVDQIVGIDNARAIFDAARHPKSFISLDNADHLLSRLADAEYAAGVIAGWSARYLPEATPPAVASTPLPPGLVTVEETRQGRFEQYVTAGSHRFLADEPVEVGGMDVGPGPYDLLLASLGACTAMTLRLYADRKKLPLERVRVTLRHRRVHAEDCVGCDEADRSLEIIDREITLLGDLDADARASLMRIADKCPVHRTLTSHLEVRTTEVARSV
jgi:putative redox protein